MIKPDVPDKLGQLLKLVFGFAREAGDQRGAEDDARDLFADFADEGLILLAGAGAVHRFQNVRVAVLHRDIEVFDQLFLRRDHVDQLVGNPLGVGVKGPDPADAVDLAELRSSSASLYSP